jgi:methylmalonyl-CoA mutase N-terminal domain/subunit
MVMIKAKLTSVKILKSLYDNFKLQTVNTKMTLQKITNRSIDMYLNDEKFREDIEKNSNLTISGSNF